MGIFYGIKHSDRITSSLRKLFVCALLTAVSLPAYGAYKLDDLLPTDPRIRMGKLDNGLSYYIQRNGRPAKKVELRLVVKAGSILEDDDQQGLAHFTEHMAFDGTRHFKKHELVSYLQSIGVKFGADLNAYTSFDQTVYILPIPTDKPENVEQGFLVLEDWAQGVTMADEAIEQERNIVLEEARMGKGADDRMRRVLLPEMFNGSKYAERLPIGKEAILKSFSHDAIRRFYADWYRPDLMAVIVVGDIDPERAEEMIRRHFAQMKNPPHERPRNYAAIPHRASSASLVITDSEATSNVVRIDYSIQKDPPDVSIADYRNDMIKSLYGVMLGTRLQELTQQANPPFIGAYSGWDHMAPGYISFSSSAYLGRGGAAPAISALVQENVRVRKFGFNSGELERARKKLLRGIEIAYNERDKTESANYANEYIDNFLEHEPILGIVNEYKYTQDLLPGITLDEANRYAKQVTPDHAEKLVAYLGSSKENENTPTRAQLLELVNSAEATPVAAAVERNITGGLMAQPPRAGSIVREQQNKELGTTELTLSNGVQVILKPTDFKNDQVLIGAARFGGQSRYGEQDMYSARYAGNMVMSMGLDKFSPADLTKVMAGKSAYVYVSNGVYLDEIGGGSGRSDIESMLQLLYLRMTSPRKDEALFKAEIRQSQDVAKDALSNPDTVFYDTAQTILYNNHPRLAHPGRPQDFSRVDLDRSLAIYRERFGSARGLTFVIVGSFELDSIKPLIATYLASLPTGPVVSGYRDLGIRPVAGVVKQEVRVGAEPKSRVSITFTGAAKYSPEENKRFQMLLEVMNIRIMEVLRQKMSLIYSGGMSGSINRVPYDSYRIGINLPCGPENVDRVIAAMLGEIEKIRQEGPQQQDMEKVKQAWLKEYQIAMRTNGTWLAALKEAVLYGTNPAELLAVEKQINALTAADIKEAANRYFNQGNYVQVVQYPEK